MTIRKSDGRRIVSITMQPELYEQLQAVCQQHDLPVTVWVREAIKARLERDG
jgi:predicted DNA-binding protein